jgi:Protein of unknown function (DUF4254)
VSAESAGGTVPRLEPASPLGGLPSVREVIGELQASTVGSGRRRPDGLLGLLRDLHGNNVAQWDLEDRVRGSDGDDAAIAEAKREIDRLNGRRHQLVEAIDTTIDTTIPQVRSATPATESPGMAFDRLSVLIIRIHHTEAAAAGDEDPALEARLPLLRTQLTVLEEALGALLRDVGAGTRRFQPHQSLKLYAP